MVPHDLVPVFPQECNIVMVFKAQSTLIMVGMPSFHTDIDVQLIFA